MLLKNSLSLHFSSRYWISLSSSLPSLKFKTHSSRFFTTSLHWNAMKWRKTRMRNSAAKSASFYWRGSRLFPFRKARVSPTRLAAVQTWNVKTRRGFTRVTPTRRDVSKRARIAATLDAFQRNRVSKPEPRPSRPFPVPLLPSISLLVFGRSSSDQHFPRLVTRRRKPPFLLFRERLLRMLR